MNVGALFPPALVSRLFEDLGAIAEAARTLPALERGVLGRLDRLAEIVAPIAEIRDVNVRLGEALTVLVDVRERIGDIDIG